jgi:uncharacterized spore protein YtfJ
MDNNANFSENIDTVFSDIQNFAKTDAVLGSPVSVGDKTLIPVMSVTLGYGSTPGKNSQGSQSVNQMSPNGVGLGARVNTNAVVVIDKDSVSMLPTNEKSNMGQLMNNIPQSIMNSIPQSVLNMGQNVLQKAMSQANQQSSQQSSGQNTQQSSGMIMGSNNNSMQNISQGLQNKQQNKYQNYQKKE